MPVRVRIAAAVCVCLSFSALQAHAALTVSVHATKNVSCSAGVCTATAAMAYLNVSDLQTMLASGDVKLVAPAAAKDIQISRAFHWGSASGLTLDAYRSIRVDFRVAVDGAGAVTLTTNGSVTGMSGSNVGGLIGNNQEIGPPDSGVVQKSYSAGAVSHAGSGGHVGGFVGSDAYTSGISGCYWDLDMSGVSSPADGAGNYNNDAGITGLADATLKSGLPAGFDPAVWGSDPAINGGLPYLLSNPPQ